MKIILQKPVDRLGDPGDVAEVADGYARNYLIPRGLAVKAEKGAVRHAESLKRAHAVRTSAQKGDFEALAARIIQTPVVVTARAGEEGKLFGSVTAADIAEAFPRRRACRSIGETSTSTSRSARSERTRSRCISIRRWTRSSRSMCSRSTGSQQTCRRRTCPPRTRSRSDSRSVMWPASRAT